ncbi:MAG: DUF4350 domain-containing protein, partial [Cyclobacteriaceae bacterium]
MRKNSYLIWMGLIIGLFIALTYALPERLDWRKTLYHKDKIPFGNYVFHDLLEQVFDTDTFVTTRQSISQVYNEKDNDDPLSMIIISESFITTPPEVLLIKEKAEKGSHFFISAEQYSGGLLDSLGLRLGFNYFTEDWEPGENANLVDAAKLTVLSHHSGIAQDSVFTFRSPRSMTYLQTDSLTNGSVLAGTATDDPVIVYCPIGKGSITVSVAPIAFTNYNLLLEDNYKYALLALSGLPADKPVYYNNYFLRGGSQSNQSSLRYIMSQPPLKNAWYLIIALLIVFAIFNAKRRQRIIPVIEPPRNTSLEFTETIGRLYYQRGDHANMARKKIDYFLEYV